MAERVVETLPLSAVVSVEIGGGYYARLHQLKATLLAVASEKDIPVIVEELKKGGTTHPIAYGLETVMVLMKDIEDQARTKGLIENTKVEVPDEQNPSSTS